ncbi:hypothetical protein CDEST_01999 [Colletotrichum destructivum]|uniref:Uncharacterized protein n=1 Tax=Colletotrichum destructivum TaxID=34406 RepID=A0AAX4I162_9PEZI|nr:hypothetical protein CDEST_01999 [Colletotrichum destructivum]
MQYLDGSTPDIQTYSSFQTCVAEGDDLLRKLAIKAGNALTEVFLVPLTKNEICFRPGAKCYKHPWRQEHAEVWKHVWHHVFDHKLRAKVKGTEEIVYMTFTKGIATLEPGRPLETEPGLRSVVIPIGESETVFNILSAKGEVCRDLPWHPGLYYILEPEVSIYSDKINITGLVITAERNPS